MQSTKISSTIEIAFDEEGTLIGTTSELTVDTAGLPPYKLTEKYFEPWEAFRKNAEFYASMTKDEFELFRMVKGLLKDV